MNIYTKDKVFLVFKISRQVGWIIAPLVFSIGFIYSGASVSTPSLLQFIILSIPYSVFLFGVNDIYDRESDRLNPRKNTYLDDHIEAFIYKVSLITVFSLIIVSLSTFNSSNIASTLITVLFSYFYSAKPVRLKELLFLDSISNGIIFFSVFSMGYSFGAGLADIPLKIYYVALCVMGIHAFGAAVDYDADRLASQRTMAVYLGKRGAFLFTFLCFILSFLFSGIGTAIIKIYLLYCTIISAVAMLFLNRKFEILLFKMIFVGFVLTSIIFLFNYYGV